METLLLLLAAFGAGALNAAAGGGTFLTLPALIFAGVPPVAANATSTVVVMPGYATAALGFQRELSALPRRDVVLLFVLAVAGGILGAVLLLVTPDDAFRTVAPWLLLLATVFFATGDGISAALARRSNLVPRQRILPVLAISTYGGYFNGGLGIMLLALYTGLGYRDLNQMNGMKNAASVVLSLSSVATFVLADLVQWNLALPMMMMAAAGGYTGAHVSRHIPRKVLKPAIIILGVTMALVLS